MNLAEIEAEIVRAEHEHVVLKDLRMGLLKVAVIMFVLWGLAAGPGGAIGALMLAGSFVAMIQYSIRRNKHELNGLDIKRVAMLREAASQRVSKVRSPS